MRIVLQRVRQASVSIDAHEHGAIGPGLLVLAGFTASDTPDDLQWTAKKITQLRIFPDSEDKMNRSLQDVGGGLLLISQFTLYASTKKGNRPSYTAAASPDVAIPLYHAFHQLLQEALGQPVPTGRFGADMQVSLLNDGPVTLTIDSQNRE